MARIAHFIDTDGSGGAERVMLDLCANMRKLGHETEVHHFGNPWLEEEARKVEIPTVLLPNESWYRSKWSAAGFSLRFGKLLRQRNIDLLHSHLYGPIGAGAVAAMAAGIGHVGTVHDVYLMEEQPSRYKVLRMAAALGTQFVVVSEDMRRLFQGLSRNDVSFERIYNGVDLTRFAPSPHRGSGRFTFISVGRLVPIKGHEVLLKALARCENQGILLRIAGDGPLQSSLESRVQALGIQERVEFLGFRDDVAELLGDADAFVLASHSEGLSCSIVEAMASSLPCIVTDVGGNRELVTDGVNGFRVGLEDVAGLGDCMARLASNRSLAAAYGKAGRARAESTFSMEATVRAYDDVYRSLLPRMESDKLAGEEARRL